MRAFVGLNVRIAHYEFFTAISAGAFFADVSNQDFIYYFYQYFRNTFGGIMEGGYQ